MRKYTTKASTRYSVEMDDDVMDVHLTVFETDDAEPTGILDANGVELWRVSERVPLGFCR